MSLAQAVLAGVRLRGRLGLLPSEGWPGAGGPSCKMAHRGRLLAGASVSLHVGCLSAIPAWWLALSKRTKQKPQHLSRPGLGQPSRHVCRVPLADLGCSDQGEGTG